MSSEVKMKTVHRKENKVFFLKKKLKGTKLVFSPTLVVIGVSSISSPVLDLLYMDGWSFNDLIFPQF